MFDTGLASIGALSLYGNNLLVGENNGPNIALLDISKPQASTIVSTISAPDFANAGITSIAIGGDNGLLAVVSGRYAFDVLDYTNPKSPQIIPVILPPPGGVPFNGPYVCHFDGSTAALGDANGNVAVFRIRSGMGASFIGQSSWSLNTITSIAVESGSFIQVAAGSYSGSEVALVSFGVGSPPPPVTPVLVGGGPGNAGGAVAFYGVPNLFASTNNNRGITWLNTEVWPNTTVNGVAANANLNPASVSTLGITYFPTPRLQLPPWLRALLALIARLFR